MRWAIVNVLFGIALGAAALWCTAGWSSVLRTAGNRTALEIACGAVAFAGTGCAVWLMCGD